MSTSDFPPPGTPTSHEHETLLDTNVTSAVPRVILPSGPFPQDLGRYRLLEHLGGGGMGSVYRSFDQQLERHVALKVPHAHLLTQPQMLERFCREARAAARLSHTHLCQVLDIGEIDGVHFLTMNYIEGQTLGRRRPTGWRAIADLVRKLALAMAEAHRLGVVHRDLKPANIIIRPDGEPVITDFGLALRLDAATDALTEPGGITGTPLYMSPEQLSGDRELVGPLSDVYSLGVILYELLSGAPPFDGTPWELFHKILNKDPEALALRRPEIDSKLSALCMKAMAKKSDERPPSMQALAAALNDCLGQPLSTTVTLRPRLAKELIRFAFVGMGSAAPASAPPHRLYLDVGNDLRPGVIDHHHLTAFAGSTASLVRAHPSFIDGAVDSQASTKAPFTIVLHEKPDLDAVVAAHLAISFLTTGSFPPGADTLARYMDKIDEGTAGLSQANPFTLYAGYLRLVDRALKEPGLSAVECWQQCVQAGIELTEFAVGRMIDQQVPLLAVDVFAGSTRLGPADRQAVQDDLNRYRQKLADPRCRARRRRLKFPGAYGGWVAVETLRIRDVQNMDDSDRVMFFKDWARTDRKHCPNRRGFDALSVFMSEGPRQSRRCVVSVTPETGASLRGLGQLLDEEEARHRKQIHGVDDRAQDPATGQRKPPRPGYANSDPWYDGRSHGYTIVDSPRAGTVLTADEIETIFLRFGGYAPADKRESSAS